MIASVPYIRYARYDDIVNILAIGEELPRLDLADDYHLMQLPLKWSGA